MTDANGTGIHMTNTKGRQRGAGIAAGLVALSLIAGACGGGGDEEVEEAAVAVAEEEAAVAVAEEEAADAVAEEEAAAE